MAWSLVMAYRTCNPSHLGRTVPCVCAWQMTKKVGWCSRQGEPGQRSNSPDWLTLGASSKVTS
jgi:hypothetical protein